LRKTRKLRVSTFSKDVAQIQRRVSRVKTMQRNDHYRDGVAATAIGAGLPNAPLRMY